jgi:hypothetical protein
VECQGAQQPQSPAEGAWVRSESFSANHKTKSICFGDYVNFTNGYLWTLTRVCEVFKKKKYDDLLSDNMMLSADNTLSAVDMMLSDNILSLDNMLPDNMISDNMLSFVIR